MGRRITHTLAASLVLALAGCGHADGGAGDASDDADSTGGSTGADATGGDVDACAPLPGRVGLQRLTRAEYNRTVRDLFGIASDPADVFPPDSRTNGFDNNAASLTVSPQLAGLLLDAAEAIAAEAMAERGAEILACDPITGPSCVRDSLAALALRVYRRPASAAELDGLEALVADATAEGEDAAGGIEHALVAMLISPQFLYRSVPTAGAVMPEPGQRVALDDYAVASRLSYFLWGSTPDDALLAAAAEGRLQDPLELRDEFDRMLADPRSDALYEGFAVQWLHLADLAAATPDPATFPGFDEELRAQMLAETRMFFADLQARDGSALEILTGTRSFASAGLAAIYGVDGPSGDALEPVDLDPTERAGILTMPAILTMTSGPSAPNVVRRGVWLADSILCVRPPPPPVGVPPAPDLLPGETERERLARHRLDPSCASCHELIDPLGFAFEHYDALGSWRDQADGVAVDAAGTLPDGRSFTGAIEMAALLQSGAGYPTCVTDKLMTYALGRTVTPAERCVVEAIGAEEVTPSSTLSDLLWAVVHSDAFRSESLPEGQ